MRTRVAVIFGVVVIALVLALAVGGSFLENRHTALVNKHAAAAASVKAEKAAKAAFQRAQHAAAVANEGKSRSLCAALLILAETKAAHRLHPVFVRVYDATDCVGITGKARP